MRYFEYHRKAHSWTGLRCGGIISNVVDGRFKEGRRQEVHVFSAQI